MYSFYGGQKGQDFRISHIFSNRSKDILQDLQARWYSPINVGDYVFVSYGDIAEKDQTFEDENGKVIEQPSKYNTNLDIDLKNCGKSYSNSLWQKIYVDENKTVSPSPFLDSDDAVFIFLNFKDSLLLDDNTQEPLLDANGNPIDAQGRKVDENGNVVDEEGNVVLFRQIPGQSLRESSDIYAEENFGFGYRLIACLTGQTPKIEVYHQTIEIDDGNPYVTLNVDNLEKPKIKFYLQKAQTLNDAVKTITLSPFEKPDVDLITNGYVNIDGELHKASLAHPILQFELPRAVQFYSGMLFGQGDLSDYPFNIATEERQSSGKQFTIDYDYALKLRNIGIALKSSLDKDACISDKDILKVNVNKFKDNFNSIINELFVDLKPYFLHGQDLLDFLDNSNEETKMEDVPWGQYGLSKNDALKNEWGLQYYLHKIETELALIASDIKRAFLTYGIETPFFPRLPWGKYGLIKASYFKEMLTDEERLDYLEQYLNGLNKPSSIVMIANLFNLYNPVINFKDIIFDIWNCEEEYYEFKPTMGAYFLITLEQLRYIYSHFKHLVEDSLPGDMYIHTPSGRLYQVSHVHNSDDDTQKYVKARYIGALTAPAPEVDSVLQNSFIKIDGKYAVNQVGVRDNIYISNNELGYKEKYIFDIPKTAEWQAQDTPIQNSEEPRIELSIVDNEDKTDGIYNLNFYLPRAIHIYTDSYLPEGIQIFFENSTDEIPTMIPAEVPAEKVCNGDIYIHTARSADVIANYDFGYDLRDEHRGYFYIYTGGEENEDGVMVGGRWVRQGSILGPIGIPEPVKLITLKATYDFPEESRGTARELSDDVYWMHVLDVEDMNAFKQVINYIFTEFLKEDDYPKSWLGEMVQFFVLQAATFYTTDNDGNQIESSFIMDSTFWGQWNGAQQEWYLTLMTSIGAYMSNSYLEGEAAKYMTYTAEYLNEKIPEWDASYY